MHIILELVKKLVEFHASGKNGFTFNINENKVEMYRIIRHNGDTHSVCMIDMGKSKTTLDIVIGDIFEVDSHCMYIKTHIDKFKIAVLPNNEKRHNEVFVINDPDVVLTPPITVPNGLNDFVALDEESLFQKSLVLNFVPEELYQIQKLYNELAALGMNENIYVCGKNSYINEPWSCE